MNLDEMAKAAREKLYQIHPGDVIPLLDQRDRCLALLRRVLFADKDRFPKEWASLMEAISEELR